MATVTPWGTINWGGVNALAWDPMTKDSPYERMSRDQWRDAFLESDAGAGLSNFFRNTSSAYGNVARQQYGYADAMAQLEDLLNQTGNQSVNSAPGANLFQRTGQYLERLNQGQLPMAIGGGGNYAQQLMDAMTAGGDKGAAIANALRTQAGRQAVTEAMTARAGLGSSGFGRVGIQGIINDATSRAFGDPDEFKWLRNLAGSQSLWGGTNPGNLPYSPAAPPPSAPSTNFSPFTADNFGFNSVGSPGGTVVR